jgi:hypothetical protein
MILAPLRNLASNGRWVNPSEVPERFMNSRPRRTDLIRSSMFLVTGSRWISFGAVISISEPALVNGKAKARIWMPLELADRSAALVDLELGLDAVPGVLEIPGAEDEIGRGVIGPAEFGQIDAGLVLQDGQQVLFLLGEICDDAHRVFFDARSDQIARARCLRPSALIMGGPSSGLSIMPVLQSRRTCIPTSSPSRR